MYNKCMIFETPEERRQAELYSELVYVNPFQPARTALERQLIGDRYASSGSWSWQADQSIRDKAIEWINAQAASLAQKLRDRLIVGQRGSDADLRLYEDLVTYTLYQDFWPDLRDMTALGLKDPAATLKFARYPEFAKKATAYLDVPGLQLPSAKHLGWMLAAFFQVRRAFSLLFDWIVGTSSAATELRATVWQSVFTHDVRRYRRLMEDRMGDFTTLVCGPSGTGKELVARAICLSRFIPFNEKTHAFEANFAAGFFPLNPAALSPTLVESELFGHRKGSFTGAAEDHPGWLEVCPPTGAVFLDEIGELDASVQVKLLRVCQARTFQRLGETRTRPFRGKLLCATNRDLPAEIQRGHFREDLYYRLCADMIRTPSLHEQLRQCPQDLPELLKYVCRHLLGPEGEQLAEQTYQWVTHHLGEDYPWPGNFRELEQCARNILIRGRYEPGNTTPVVNRTLAPLPAFAQQAAEGTLTADELLGEYCRHMVKKTGGFVRAAKVLQLDRRTIRKYVDAEP